tara:strand:- start:782 stop:1477 length:696 start_codon:yes stop_codon:yes gene_type:complete
MQSVAMQASYKLFGQTELRRLEHMGWDVFCNEPSLFNSIVGSTIAQYILEKAFSGEQPPPVEIVFLFDSADSLRFALYMLGLKQHLTTFDSKYYACTHIPIQSGVFEEHVVRYKTTPLTIRLRTENYSFFHRIWKNSECTTQEKTVVLETVKSGSIYVFPALGQDFFTRCGHFAKSGYPGAPASDDIILQTMELDTDLSTCLRVLNIPCQRNRVRKIRVPSTRNVMKMWSQ